MQHRYTGDIGDYVKYGLLRALAGGRKLGVAWYLFPDEGHNEDGRHSDYLDKPNSWRSRDPALFDLLKKTADADRRTVSAIEESGVLGSTCFSSEPLDAFKLTPAHRRAWRGRWFDTVQAELQNCDLVFADPDNGLCEDEKFRAGRVKDWKRMPIGEAKALAHERIAIVYHHNSRRKGGHAQEIAYWIDLLGPDTLALRWRAYNSRTFFVINPTAEMDEVLQKFAFEWGSKAEVFR